MGTVWPARNLLSLKAMQTQNDIHTLSREPVVVDSTSRALYALATRVASTDCTVLINGESGTGKEVLARFIHDKSTRATRPFIAINCAAIPENMLFGYERGAFTGATSAHAGKFEQAQGGTLLLDEITEMPLSLQAKLLRVLQEREVERLGARTMISLDVRVLATTNRDLRAEVKAGNFREDLFYRLCVFPMTITALRDRRDDVLPLAMRLLEMRTPPGRRIPALSADAAQLLLSYAWPGNIRELDNLLQRASIIANGPVIDAPHIRFEGLREIRSIRVAAPVAELDRELRGTLRAAEKQILLTALNTGTSRREVAERLGISPRTLRYKLAQLRSSGVDVPAA
jgi:two-component system, response regulator FlrC